MGSEIKEEPEKRVKDVTKPWLKQFIDCKEKGPEPPFNAEGLWKKPVHGWKIKEGN